MNAENRITLPVNKILDGKIARLRRTEDLYSLLYELVFTATIVVLLVFVVFGFATVDGNSMYPALRDGDLVMLYRLEKTFQAGDVVAFELNGTEYVKRIVAVAGDIVSIDNGSGYLLVNGNVMNNDILFPTKTLGASVQFPYTVPDNSVFVLGDNRENSTDSRVFSAVSLACVQGKVMLVFRTRVI